MGITIDPTPFANVADTITGRRTVKDFDGQPVDRDSLEQLLDLARWAPNHRLTNPWRFAVLDQAAIARLATFLQSDPAITSVPDPAKGKAKLTKLLVRLPRLGALIQVAWMRHANPAIDLEEHAATAAAVQNLLLGAHAMGLGSFWSTNAALSHPLSQRWYGFDPAIHGFLGSIWLGHATVQPEAPPRRPLAEVTTWL